MSKKKKAKREDPEVINAYLRARGQAILDERKVRPQP